MDFTNQIEEQYRLLILPRVHGEPVTATQHRLKRELSTTAGLRAQQRPAPRCLGSNCYLARLTAQSGLNVASGCARGLSQHRGPVRPAGASTGCWKRRGAPRSPGLGAGRRSLSARSVAVTDAACTRLCGRPRCREANLIRRSCGPGWLSSEPPSLLLPKATEVTPLSRSTARTRPLLHRAPRTPHTGPRATAGHPSTARPTAHVTTSSHRPLPLPLGACLRRTKQGASGRGLSPLPAHRQ